jgi:hypothetical protein
MTTKRLYLEGEREDMTGTASSAEPGFEAVPL